MKPYHESKYGVLYCGDCMEIMPHVKADVVLTDPPYGINADRGFSCAQSFGGKGKKRIERRVYNGGWDDKTPEKEVFNFILRFKIILVFGGNYFAHMLPQSTHWIVWDKMQTMPTFSKCELIWTNSKRKSVEKYTVEWNGLLGEKDRRCHPSQKPSKLLQMLISDYFGEEDIIIDPFAGSGTTAVASIKTNRRYILIEKEEQYCEIAAKRIEQACYERSLL